MPIVWRYAARLESTTPEKKQNALNIIAHFQATFDNQSADESLECQVRTIMTAILVTLMTV